jgi:hypothetical protein
MSSSNGDSDVRPDRIRAREEHYRQGALTRSPSPAIRKGIDSTELDCVGAHLELALMDQSWPNSIGELTDDEAEYQ